MCVHFLLHYRLLDGNQLTLDAPYELILPVNADTMINLELQGNRIRRLGVGTIKYADSLESL